MKRMFFILALVLATSVVGLGQLSQSPQSGYAFYTYSVVSDSPLTASEIDTVYAGDGLGSRVSKFSEVTFQITPTDSAALDVYFDWSPFGSTTWTNISAATDSVKYAPADSSSLKHEFVLKGPTIDRFSGLDRIIRVRISARATGQGVNVGYYDAKWLYKP